MSWRRKSRGGTPSTGPRSTPEYQVKMDWFGELIRRSHITFDVTVQAIDDVLADPDADPDTLRKTLDDIRTRSNKVLSALKVPR